MADPKAAPTVDEVLARLRAIDREPECVDASQKLEVTRRAVADLDSRVKALTDQISEAEHRTAEALSSGYVPTGNEVGEELTPLRLARQKVRDELRLAENAVGMARKRLETAREAAAERLRPLFLKAYRAKVAFVLDAIEAAAAENRELQELELAARQVLGSSNVPGSFVFTRLLPSTPSHESSFEYWRRPVAKFLGRDS